MSHSHRDRIFLMAAAAIVAFGFAAPAAAQTTWQGGTSDWNESGNWTNGVPNSTTSVILGGNGSTTVEPGGIRDLKDLTYTSGALGFTIGNTSGGQLNFASGGFIDVNAGVTENEVINAAIGLSAGDFGITHNGTGGLTIGGVISGDGKLVKTGSGTLTLGATTTNAWSGGTDVSGGVLSITDAISLGADSSTNIVTISNGATLRRTGTTGSGTNPNSFGTRPIVIGTGGGIIEVTSTAGTGNEGVQIGNDLLSGTGNLTKTGAGVLVLGGDNSEYTGSQITVNGGNNGTLGQTGLRLLSDNALGASGSSIQVVVNVVEGGPSSHGNQLHLRSVFGGEDFIPINIPANKSLVMNNSTDPLDTEGNDDRVSLISDLGSNTWNGPITINGRGKVQLVNQTAGQTFTVNGSITGDGGGGSGNWLTLRGTGGDGVIGSSSTINLSAAGTLLKAELGNWTINSTGHTWGTTRMEQGTLKLGAQNVLPTTSTLQMGNNSNSNAPTLDLNGFNQTVGNLTFLPTTNILGVRTITNLDDDASTFTVNNATDGFYNGTNTVIAGNLSLVKSGTGTLTLGPSGPDINNTYTGTTTVNGGKLIVDGSHTGGGLYTVESGGTLGGSGNLGSSTVNVAAGGLLAPGGVSIDPDNRIGTFSVGDADIDGTLKIEFGDNTIDNLLVSGALDLTNTVINFTALGDLSDGEYTFAQFGSLTLPGGGLAALNSNAIFPPSSSLAIIQVADQLRLDGAYDATLPGDFNGDGFVDAADYVYWRQNDGSQQGYDDWREHFGESGGGAALNSSIITAVPEPSALLLAILLCLGVTTRRVR